ncbi:hypothetical protein FA15DRAFT_596157 [Coprinopsis marcescibilis]|uniref:F-box domain-containing protein n=1 Tax=Coprinopsis marcescibilis TaxID=230819 RepID=A0A5C3KQ19_COPMA|nr:hypothetical protein FA15DRAFT_596157 [Coprinopsis marcescibilis]
MSCSSAVSNDVLSNEDLMNVVFGYLLEDVDFPPLYRSRRQLLWVALTCKSFLEPALDALWTSLPGLPPLLKLIPNLSLAGDTYVIGNSNNDRKWDKVQAYGRRVRSIVIEHKSQPPQTVSPFAYQVISMCAGSEATNLFPNLKTLTVNLTGWRDYASAFLALSSCLEKIELIHIQGSNDAEFVRAFLTALPAKAKNLRKLELSGKGDASVVDSLFQIHHFKGLSDLTLMLSDVSIPLQLLVALGRLRNLSSLTLHPTNIASTSSSPYLFSVPPVKMEGGSVPMFPALSYLTIGGSPGDIATSLSYTISPRIQKLSLLLKSERESEAHLVDCFQRISSMCPNLQAFEISCTIKGKIIPSILPLLDLKALTFFRIDAGILSCSNELVATIATSLPNLTTLHLPAVSGSQSPDLGCLILLASHCPSLIDVRICLNLDTPPGRVLPSSGDGETNPGQRSIKHTREKSSHGLQSLWISDSGGDRGFSVAEMIAMARFLLVLFPQLETFGLHKNSRGEGKGKASVFQDIFSILCAVREGV